MPYYDYDEEIGIEKEAPASSRQVSTLTPELPVSPLSDTRHSPPQRKYCLLLVVVVFFVLVAFLISGKSFRVPNDGKPVRKYQEKFLIIPKGIEEEVSDRPKTVVSTESKKVVVGSTTPAATTTVVHKETRTVNSSSTIPLSSEASFASCTSSIHAGLTQIAKIISDCQTKMPDSRYASPSKKKKIKKQTDKVVLKMIDEKCSLPLNSSYYLNSSSNNETMKKEIKHKCATQWLTQCWYMTHRMMMMKNTNNNHNANNNSNRSTNNTNNNKSYSSSSKSIPTMLQDLNTCNPKTIQHILRWKLKAPKKEHVWRKHGATYLSLLRKFLVEDDYILATECQDIRLLSRYLCQNIAHRQMEIDFDIIRHHLDNNQTSTTFDDHQQQQSQGKNAHNVIINVGGSGTLTLRDDFLLNYPLKVLEFTDRTSSRKQNINNNDDQALTVDLIVTGMFPENIDRAKILWSKAEDVYFSKFEFRHRHFFQWNTVRKASARLEKAKRLYGDDLKERMNNIRSQVLKNEFTTWLTLDIDSGGSGDSKKRMEELVVRAFHQNLIMRFIAIKYLAFSASSPSSSSSYSLPDFLLFTRPDLSYAVPATTVVSRAVSSSSERIVRTIKERKKDLEDRSSGSNSSSIIHTRSSPSSTSNRINLTPRMYSTGQSVLSLTKRTRRINGGGRKRKLILISDDDHMTIKSGHIRDPFLLGDTEGILLLYDNLANTIHSCLSVPYPRDMFIEYYLSTIVSFFRPEMVVERIFVGLNIDRV